MTAEEKVLELLRKLCIADTNISGIVGNNVSISHPSTTSNPVLPMISFYKISSNPLFFAPDVVEINMQIDIWMDSFKQTIPDLYSLAGDIRTLLNRSRINDTDIGVNILQIYEVASNAVMYEQENNIYHLPIVYRVVAK